MRCFCPYRPSRDVDFGVTRTDDLNDLVRQLERRGHVELTERTNDTVHLRFDGIDVSIFVLDMLSPFVNDRRLSVTGLLATKLHAILDRGTRRDFFDLYVTLHRHALGIAECLAAMRHVYRQDVNETLLLRALTFYDDAEREAPLPGEGPRHGGKPEKRPDQSGQRHGELHRRMGNERRGYRRRIYRFRRRSAMTPGGA